MNSVREGLVYVSMTLSDLSKYMDPPQHARLRGIDTPPYRQRRAFRASPERITLSDALRDPEVSAAIEDRERGYAERADAMNDLNGGSYGADDYEFGRHEPDSHCDFNSSGDAADIVVTADDSSLPFTLLSDEEPGPEESSSQEVLDFRQQRLRSMRRRYELEALDRERERWAGSSRPEDDRGDDSWNLRRLDAMMARSRMADSPQHDLDEQYEREGAERYTYRPGPEPGHGPSYYQTPEQKLEATEYYDDGLNDPNVTRARFHIKRRKYKVAIKFDPPVSGRFVLLKLWANKSNVDVQSVIAKGFGGLRFFPAVEYR